MTDLNVIEAAVEPDSTEIAAHDTAVAEGAVAVMAQDTQEAASQAKGAAEAALSAAASNIESGEEAVEASVVAQGAAATAQISAEMVHEALLAQTAAIAALVTEIQESRKPVPQKPSRSRRDREPGSSGPRLVRR